MDPFKFTTVGHAGMPICNPLGDKTLDEALEQLELPPGARVLDVGCGKGELLLRLIERRGVVGVGVDINAAFLGEARAQAARRGAPVGALTLHELPFAEFAAAQDASAFDAVLCIGASHAIDPPREALPALAALVRPGGALLVGDGYWKREPDPEYLSLLGAEREDYRNHSGNRELGARLGLRCVHAAITADADFDRYEERYAGSIEAFVAAHPEDADAHAMAHRIATWRAGYRRWGRDTLGFGLYVFRA